MSRHLIAFVPLVFIVASACGGGKTAAPLATGPAKYGTGVKLPGEDGTTARPKRQSTAAAPRRTATRAAPRPRGTAPPVRTVPPGLFSSNPDDSGPLGRNAIPYLRKQPLRKLVIEVNAVAGYAPRPAAMALLKARLEDVLDKPAGIEILPSRTFSSNQQNYTTEDIKRLEGRHRRRHSDANAGVGVIHFLYLNGRYEDSGALGVAYRASSIAIFREFVDDIGNPAIAALSPEAIEKATVVHEAGHILGLVNIGYRSPRPHEDRQHPGHSKSQASVMYWAVETASVTSIFSNGPPNAYDADDIADLEDRKTGKV